MPADSVDVSSPDDSPTFGKDGHFEVNKPVGSMSISPCGRDVVLASRHGLHIIDLDSPWSPPRHLAHHTPWEVADVQWSPFPSKDHWVVSTSNQKALVWNLEMSSRHNPIEFTLHGHSRALTDIQFSAHDPNTLATCAVDSFVHCWDLRTPQRPAYSFCDWFAGATQTKWNRLNPHIIASSHDRTLHIWDNRKGAYPLRSLDAHDTKIYGIDWDRTSAHRIITCSLDKSVKFWDYSAEADRPERLLRTPFPVWRARHTPFGQGIMAMPQRGDFNLHLYDCREESIWDRDLDRAPRMVAKFSGHQDNVKEFLWRPRGMWAEGSDNREFQLVTWGADRILRLHHLNDEMLQQVGFERGRPGNFTTRKNARYRTFRVAHSHLPNSPPENTLSLGLEDANALTAKAAPMSSSPLGGPLGWADAGFLNTQPGIRAKAPPRREVDPISWMKGVKIGKHDTKEKPHHGSAALPTLSIDSWEQFENLGEEVKHVGQTFSKVEFGGVDINKRFLTMSLYAPWGKERAQVFMSCRMQFPTKYPSETAEFILEDSTTVNPEDTEEIRNTTRTIAKEFAQRGKPSIEAIVRFLHRERTLDDLMGWLRQGLSTPNMLPTTLDEESSSDEEEELGRVPGTQLDELGLAESDVLNNSNANATMPLPGQCGARWSRDGRLVCFFRPQIEKAGSVTGVFGLDGQSGTSGKKSRYFDGFGRVDLPRESGRSRASSRGTLDSDESSIDSDSDDSDSPSTTDSSLEEDLSDRQYTTSQSLMQTSLIARAVGLKSQDGLHGSQSSKKPAFSYIREKKSVVSIKDFRVMMPAKRELASYQYQGLDLGLFNAELALLNGSSELADAWSMASNLCQWHESTIPATKTETTSSSKFLGHLGAIPGHLVQPMFNTLAASLSDSSASVRMSIALGLFFHFACRSDIQMAATLACAFQPFITPHRSEELHHSLRTPSHANNVPDVPAEDLRGIRSAVNTKVVGPDPQTASDPVRPVRTDSDDLLLQPPSLASSLGADEPYRRSSFSTGNTPPSRRIPKAHELRKEGSFSHLKPSPTSRLWQLESAAGGIIAGAGNFANAITQNFSFSASSSPPTRKWPSPSMSFTTAKSHLTRTPGASMIQERRKWSIPDEFPEEEQESRSLAVNAPKRRRYRVTYKHPQSTKAGPPSALMTCTDQNSLYSLFDLQRTAYADLLTVWGLPIARAEVLKHNTTPGTERNTAEQPSENAPLKLGKIRSTSDSRKPGPPPGLLARRLCPFCSATNWLERRNSAFACLACTRRVPPLACVFCNKLMRGRTYPCFNCGHVMHARCRTRLATETGYDGRCIEGCDCACPSAVVVQVPSLLSEGDTEAGRHVRMGSTETADSRVTEIKLEVLRGGDGEVVREEEARPGHGQAWEEMAKESLARNLGGLGAVRRSRSSDGRGTGTRERAYRPLNMHMKRRGGAAMGTLDESFGA